MIIRLNDIIMSFCLALVGSVYVAARLSPRAYIAQPGWYQGYGPGARGGSAPPQLEVIYSVVVCCNVADCSSGATTNCLAQSTW